MELIDCNGKLNEHEEFVKILRKIRKKCQYIEIVFIYGPQYEDFTQKFKNDILETKIIYGSLATQSMDKNTLVRFKATTEFFEYLETFETFCKFLTSNIRGDYAEFTDFEDNDIAFYDNNEIPLLLTQTHEGDVWIRDDII